MEELVVVRMHDHSYDSYELHYYGLSETIKKNNETSIRFVEKLKKNLQRAIT